MATTRNGVTVTIMCHDVPMRSMDHLLRYLQGDAHDRSKVEIEVYTNDGEFFRIPFPFTPFSDEQE